MSKILDYVAQPNAYTCQSACIAKVLGSKDVEGIRAALEAIGTPGSPDVMGQYLKSRVQSYQFLVSGSLADAKNALDRGCVVITHGWYWCSAASLVVSFAGSWLESLVQECAVASKRCLTVESQCRHSLRHFLLHSNFNHECSCSGTERHCNLGKLMRSTGTVSTSMLSVALSYSTLATGSSIANSVPNPG